MSLQQGYILLTKPAVLTGPEWTTVLVSLRGLLGKDDQASNPVRRLHYRLSLDGTQVIIEAVFDSADLDPTDLTRLCKYISDSLAGKYTPTQVRTALNNKVTVWNGSYVASGDAARAYLAANSANWEVAP